MFENRVSLFVLTWFFCATSALAGPFGLEMGMSLQAIGGEPEKLGSGKYRLTNVPKPHSAFEAYIVQVAPKSGLCWVKAIGEDIPTSVFGTQLKSKFEQMKDKLEKSYGKHETIDFLMPGSIWNEPKDFMMGMIKKERFLMAIWSGEKNSTLTDNLKQIGLIASPSARDTGHLAIEYSFENEKSCEAELAAQEDGSL